MEGERVVAGGHWLEPGEFTLTMVADGDRPSTTLGGGTGVIVLDVDVTPELEQEGRARDLIRLVQQARRDADFAVTDRIALAITADADWIDAADAHHDLIAAETLATSIDLDAGGSDTPDISVHRAG
jgi:isoleucyl-tRNA synthetase